MNWQLSLPVMTMLTTAACAGMTDLRAAAAERMRCPIEQVVVDKRSTDLPPGLPNEIVAALDAMTVREHGLVLGCERELGYVRFKDGTHQLSEVHRSGDRIEFTYSYKTRSAKITGKIEIETKSAAATSGSEPQPTAPEADSVTPGQISP